MNRNQVTSFDEATNDLGIVGIPASCDSAGVGDGIVKLHHELRWNFVMSQILALTPNAKDLQCYRIY